MATQKTHRFPPRLLEFARTMRHERAPAEDIIWRCVRNRQIGGFKFRRQVPIGSFIADFYCAERRLIIELDGDSHSEREEYDRKRTEWMQIRAFSVARFTNIDVFENLEGVLDAILRLCETNDSRELRPSP